MLLTINLSGEKFICETTRLPKAQFLNISYKLLFRMLSHSLIIIIARDIMI